MDFIDGTSGYSSIYGPGSRYSQSPSEVSSSQVSSTVSGLLKYEFYVKPPHRELFIALFNAAKKKLLGKGFSL